MQDPGEGAKAKAIATREQAQIFNLLLKLTLGNGHQTIVQADSLQVVQRLPDGTAELRLVSIALVRKTPG